MDIVFLGSGNTATALARLMLQKGHRILQIWSRNSEHAKQLALEVNAEVLKEINAVSPSVHIIVLALSDDAVEKVAEQLSLQSKLVVHTAGSINMNVLRVASRNYGVLYPLQSLQKQTKTIAEIPFLVDGNSEETKELLFTFAKSLSAQVQFANDADRLYLHAGAVIVNNFTNHLYAVTDAYCQQHGLDFSLLHPLIIETAQRLQNGSAYNMQTGPAKRGDEETIKKHLALLEGNRQLQLLYQTISNSISEMYHKNNELRKQ
jgi:predicted short-subunit dehydrogenase-like oxidoreductase (DUF2520 family)